jgi:NAD(P)-dependent dehydrogenase (short-subunit alcohol dehydrogenase family)
VNKPVVMITGALAGIGRATAVAFAREGVHLVVSGRRDHEGVALAKELRGNGAEVEFIHADIRREADIINLVDQTVQRFGRLDIAINNAGTEGKGGPLTQLTAEDYAETFETNVLGTMLCLKHELRVMTPQGSGSIVNLSSTLGQRAVPGVALYAASKHAIEGLTKVAALEAVDAGIRVNAVGPGPVDTEMLDRFSGSPDRKAGVIANVPMKRAGTPDEIANVILFVASEKASYITGQIIQVSGGRAAT